MEKDVKKESNPAEKIEGNYILGAAELYKNEKNKLFDKGNTFKEDLGNVRASLENGKDYMRITAYGPKNVQTKASKGEEASRDEI